jgi:hypothetical protein
MTTQFKKGVLIAVFVTAAGTVHLVGPAAACPVCPVAEHLPTLHQQYARADAAVLAKWIAGEAPGEKSPGSTLYRVLQVPRGAGPGIERGATITLETYHPPKNESLVLLLGKRSADGFLEWSPARDVDSVLYNYIVRAPARDAEPGERLRYYLEYLEHANPEIASDSYAELTDFSIHELAAHPRDLPRDLLRKAIGNPDLNPLRRTLFGIMLGLCGDRSDAELLLDQFADPAEETSFGVEGLMIGYMLITGEAGLQTLEELNLRDPKTSPSDAYAAFEAVRYLLTWGGSGLPPERLRKALHPLIERSDFIDSVTLVLARGKDWSVQPRLMQLFGAGEFDARSTSRAIIRYMLASTRDAPAFAEGHVPLHVAEGLKHLAELRRREPRLVSECEQFFYSP